MIHDNYLEIVTGDNYRKTVQRDGVKTTMCLNRFEVLCLQNADMQERQIMAMLKDWLRYRRQEMLRVSGDMPE